MIGTVFLTHYRLHKWVMMSMSLKTALVIFIKMMNNLFVEIMQGKVLLFLDNLLSIAIWQKNTLIIGIEYF